MAVLVCWLYNFVNVYLSQLSAGLAHDAWRQKTCGRHAVLLVWAVTLRYVNDRHRACALKRASRARAKRRL